MKMSLSIKIAAVLVSLVTSVSVSQLWSTKILKDSSISSSSNIVELSDLSEEYCVLDEVTLLWENVKHSPTSAELYVAVSLIDDLNVAVTSLYQTDDSATSSSQTGVIACLLNEPHCTPSVVSIVAVTADLENPKLKLTFSEDTNRPFLSSTKQVMSALHVHPPLTGSAVGDWISANELEISVDKEYMSNLISEYHQGVRVTVSVRTQPPAPHKQGRLKFHVPEIGKINIFALNLTSLQRVSNVVSTYVSGCDGKSFVPTRMSRVPNQAAEVSLPAPVVRLRGVLPVGDNQDFSIPHSSVPGFVTGSWSLTFWLRLVEGPTGSFRTLFFKGNGVDGQRSPSAWLTPQSSRVCLRVSSEVSDDVGSDAQIIIPPNEWTFFAFTFFNSTDQFQMKLFINGLQDVAITVTDKVLGNSHDLHLFQDISHKGPRGFAKDVIVWDTPLLKENVLSLFSRGPGDTSAVDVALSLLNTEDTLRSSECDESNPLCSSETASQSTLSPADPLLSDVVSRGLKKRRGTSDDDLPHTLLAKALSAKSACELFELRLDSYAEASEAGSREALYYWAMLTAFGSESNDVNCGMNATEATGDDFIYLFIAGKEERVSNQARAILALIFASHLGHAEALVPLSALILSGIGTHEVLQIEDPIRVALLWNIPIPRTLQSSASKLLLSHIQCHEEEMLTNEVCDNKQDLLPDRHSSSNESTYFYTTIIESLRQAAVHCSINKRLTDFEVPIGSSSLCWNDITTKAAGQQLHNEGRKHAGASDSVTTLAVGLLHLASLLAVAEADQVLTQRYRLGYGVLNDDETAAFYAMRASAASSEAFHLVGGQPVLETDRINDKTEREIKKGNSGDDDELIRYQKIRADEGDVPAMLAMGDLYYYGAHGLGRDQGQALHYYQRAAAAGNAAGMCGTAGMLLKGEGGGKNVTLAMELYEDAAKQGAVRALNGLGFIYFYGQVVPKNQTKAFEYFLEAANLESDGDSLFNAGLCLQMGFGTEVDLPRAVIFFNKAAVNFGHFDSARALGIMHMKGQGVTRSASHALPFLLATVQIGPWSRWLRRGLDQYLHGDYVRSLQCYVLAGEFGYEVAQANAAFILRRKLKASPLLDAPSSLQVASGGGSPTLLQVLTVRQYAMSASRGNLDSMFNVGHAFFTGFGLQNNKEAAAWWYSKASAGGYVMGSVYLGVMNHFGLGIEKNLPRAQQYYYFALASASKDVSSTPLSSSDKDVAQLKSDDPAKQLSAQIKALVQGLQYLAGSNIFSFFSPVAVSVEYAMHLLWGVDN